MTNEELHEIHDEDTKISAEDAIEVLRHPAEFESTEAMNIACDMAIEALKKQIPMKQRQEFYEINIDGNRGKLHDNLCPVCGHLLQKYEEHDYGNIGNRFCGGCGQKIDWSVEWSK